MSEELPIDPDLLADEAAAPAVRRARSPRPPPAVRRPRPDVLAAIATGGAAGAATRVALGELFTDAVGHFPYTTVTINLTGSFVLGALIVVLVERLTHNRYLQPLFATGFLGSYTTFSTFAVHSVELFRHGHVVVAVVHLAVTVLGGLVATRLGMAVGRSRHVVASEGGPT